MRELLWAAFFTVVGYLLVWHLITHSQVLQQVKVDIEHRSYQIERMLDRR